MPIRIQKLAIILGIAMVITIAVTQVKKMDATQKANIQRYQSELKVEQEKHQREIEAQDKASQEKIEQQKKELESEIERLRQEVSAKKAKTLADAQKAAQSVATKVVPQAKAASVPAGSVQEIIVKWANYYGVDPNMLLRIAKCESGFNPNAINRNYSVNGTHPSGLFQHVAVYWPARAAKYGVPGASVFDADANARVTAGMFRDGQASAWECK